MKEEELSDGFDIEDDEVLLEDPLSIVGKKLILIEDDEVLLEELLLIVVKKLNKAKKLEKDG